MSKRSKYFRDDHQLDNATSRRIGYFLFSQEPEPEDQYKESDIVLTNLKHSREILPSSIINGPELANAIGYYSTLRDLYESRSALVVVNILQKMSVAFKGVGRDQGTTILNNSLPKEIEIETSQL